MQEQLVAAPLSQLVESEASIRKGALDANKVRAPL